MDALLATGIAAFGPTAAAAKLEGSKAFAKEAMEAAGVPTARWRRVSALQDGLDAVQELARNTGEPGAGVVVKADGLAAGKGVTVADTPGEAEAALVEIFEGRFGDGEISAVVEERLTGEECSLLALCDGERAVPLAPARDFKRIGDGDRGPNTGGMGSYSPVVGFDEARVREIVAVVHQPVVDLMRARGTPFHGVLYAGLMLTPQGLRVLEFNVRFGDPETQAVLPRLRSDLLELLLAATRPGGLAGVELEWSSRVGGDGGAGERRLPRVVLRGRSDRRARAACQSAVEVTHAGTARTPEGVRHGGRPGVERDCARRRPRIRP